MNLQFNSLLQEKIFVDPQTRNMTKRYIQQMIKHLPSVMAWGAILIKGTAKLQPIQEPRCMARNT